MFFNKKYLTTAGKDLLDQAVAGSTIIWGKCATSSLSYVDDAHARALTDIAVDGKYTSLGTVTSVDPNNSANSNLVIKGSVTNSGSNVVSGEARAFGVWAKIGASGTNTLVAVAFWDLSEGHPDIIPSSSQSEYSATVDLYVKTSDEAISTIQSNPSWMTPLDDFNNLKNRVVTTHSASGTSTGDNQIIKGVKTFDNNTTFNGYTIFNGTVLFDNTVQFEDDVGINGSFFADDIETSDLSVNSSVALGNINNVPAVQIIASENEDTVSGELTFNFKSSPGGDNGGSLILDDLDIISLTPVSYGTIDANNYSLTIDRLLFDDGFSAYTSSTDNSKRFNFTYGNLGLSTVFYTGDYPQVHVVPYASTVLNIGATDKKVNRIDADYIYVTNIYADNMNAIIDNRISEIFSTTAPLGAHRLVYIDAYNSGTDDYYMNNAYADVGDHTDSSGKLSLEIRYYDDDSSLVSTGDYISGKQLHLSDGTSVTGTWEIVRSFKLLADITTNARKYFIAKRIA